MRWKRVGFQATLPGLLLLCGCVTLPWFSPPPPPPPAPPPEPPEAIRPVVHEEPASRQAAELAHKLAAAQDENKVLAARIQEVQSYLDEKTRALDSARGEIHHVTEEVGRTREEIDRWRRAVATLRQRAETAEKENQASLKAMVNLLEMMVEQESPPGVPPANPVLPAPTPNAKSVSVSVKERGQNAVPR